jgi:peptidylprolyl isomerase
MKKTTVALAAGLAALAATAIAQPKKPAAPAAAAPAATKPGPNDWRTPSPDDLMIIDTNKGRIIVELIPEVAPLHVERYRELTKSHMYDGLTFFRVIDAFMAQTGDPKNTGEGSSELPDLKAEFTFRRAPDAPVVVAADKSVSEVGFLKSLPFESQSMMLAPMTRDGKVTAWGLYCPGVLGAARGNDENTANSQFFLMRQGYPSLEKRYTAFGRVISGLEVVRAIRVGEPVEQPQDVMTKVRMASELSEAERPKVRVINPQGPWFKAEIARVRAAKGADFSACDVNIPVEVK